MGIPIPKTLAIWASPSFITLGIWVRVRVTGRMPISLGFWEWGCPKRGNARHRPFPPAHKRCCTYESVFALQIKLDIVPEKGWHSEDMFVPPGYHLDSVISDDSGSPKEPEPTAYVYPAGLGNVIMNGCYGTGYQETDPCYVAKWALDACLVSIQDFSILQLQCT